MHWVETVVELCRSGRGPRPPNFFGFFSKLYVFKKF